VAIDWSSGIVIASLADEPALSDELGSLGDRVDQTPEGELPAVVLNFADVTYLNSSNIAQLLRIRRRLADGGKPLRLCSVPDPVWSIMLLTGLDKVFEFAHDPATAIASIQIDDRGDGGAGAP
jgi:anti-anti-sigma factor